MNSTDSRPLMVTIRCITYNHEPYIRQCLEGFVMQKTNFRFEAVVHDDASTDGTANIIREYAEKYPDIIKPIYENENQYSKHDGSLTRIMNEACKGKYVALCEGDDYWIDPLKLQKQVDFLETHSDYAMCFSRAKVLLEINSPLYINCFNICNREYSASELFSCWIVPTASMLFHKEIFDYPITDAQRILNGDIFLIEICAHIGKVWGMSDFMVVYRMQSHGTTYKRKEMNYKIMKYPDHYECIKDNFPKIEKKILYQKLAECYYNRAQLQSDKTLRKVDLKMVEKYVPGYLKTKQFKIFKNKIRNILKNLI